MTDFAWRVSLADVGAGGPFSRFEEVDRVITVVEGAGMALTVDGTEHRLAEPFRPFAFAGDAATDCRLLDGPVVDFNVMTRRGRAAAEVEITDHQRELRVPGRAELLLVCLGRQRRAGHRRPPAGALRRGTAARRPEDLLRVDGVAALVTLRRLG